MDSIVSKTTAPAVEMKFFCAWLVALIATSLIKEPIPNLQSIN